MYYQHQISLKFIKQNVVSTFDNYSKNITEIQLLIDNANQHQFDINEIIK